MNHVIFFQGISVGSSSSSSISSPLGDHYYHTKSPKTTCTFQIDTTTGYILELSFDDMSISSCSSCSCGYVKVRDGSSSSAKLLGIYCNGNYQGTVSSEGNHMFVEYYGYYSGDSFKATVRSKKGTPLSSQNTVEPRLSGHPRGNGKWQPNRGWPLDRGFIYSIILILGL